MILYLIIIVGGGFSIAALVAFFAKKAFVSALLFTWLAIALIVALDAFIATLSRLLPKKCACPSRKIFAVSRKEKLFYEKLKIRKWKDKIPEIGHFTGFRKNKLIQPQSLAYIQRFLLENCYGEIGHFLSAVFGFLILLVRVWESWLLVALPVAFVNATLNVLPLFVLRYNCYKLRVLQKNLQRKTARSA